MASSNLGTDAPRVEDFRGFLPRNYGFELSKDQYALYVRIPFAEIVDLTSQGLIQMERAFGRFERDMREQSETTFLIADKDFVEIGTDRFLGLMHDREVGPIKQLVSDLLKRLETGRDGHLRRIITDISQERQRELLSSVRHGGRAATRLVVGKRGRVVGYRAMTEDGSSDIAVLPTIRASIRRGAKVEGNPRRLQIATGDIQENLRYTRIGSYVCIVVDSSTYEEEIREQMEGLVNSILLDCYERRDRVALIHSIGDKAQILSDFTTDLESIRYKFFEGQWGGLSPYASGIMAGARLFQARLADTIDAVRILIVLTTGRSNIPMVQGGNLRRELTIIPHTVASIEVNPIIVDCTTHGSAFLREFARDCRGTYYHPGSVRYHKVALAQELLSSFETGKSQKAAEVGKALLEKMVHTRGGT